MVILPKAEKSKPVAAFILSLLGGIFVLVSSVIRTLLLAYGFEARPLFRGLFGPSLVNLGIALGILGTVFGVIIISLAIMLWRTPERHELLGTLIIVFSVISVITHHGVVVVAGIILSIIGGILAIAKRD